MYRQTQNMDTLDLEVKLARNKASVKWLLSKAYNNRIPDNVKEPYFRDHEGQEHLKPQIVVGLGNASLYCQTLANLYTDPNYQSSNHWSILQTFTRKGVPVPDNPEVPLTETVLIQTNPLRINAHMAVIESLMILYAKEVASIGRVNSAIGRISGGVLPKDVQHHESALLYWVSHACAALKRRIDQEIESGATDENGVRLQSPDIPPLREYKDLCDGVCLAFLISYYCPKVVPWNSIRVNYLPTVEDSIYNVLLVSNFSQKHLPYSVFHMTPQDITYMRGSMKQNLVALLADLFNLFEIHPSKCVCYPGMEPSVADRDGINEHGISHRRGLTCQPVTPIPDLRSGFDSPTSSPSIRLPFQVTRSASATTMRKSTPPREVHDIHQTNPDIDEDFVVHKGRIIPTLSAMQEPIYPARIKQAKEKTNVDSKGEERGDSIAAGRPSNWENTKKPSFSGRRSRRNSITDDSQLTIENFGGSQDQLNMVGHSVNRDRKISAPSLNNVIIEPAVAVRSSLADARGTIQIGYENDSGSEKQDKETEKVSLSGSMHNRGNSSKSEGVSLQSLMQIVDNDVQHNLDEDQNQLQKPKTSFATVPNTTTWQQQSANSQQHDNDYNDDRPLVDASKLSTIRMKLEEKRRHIEQEKRKIELAMNKQQQKVGKAAFLQAINKGKTQNTNVSRHNNCDVLDSAKECDKPKIPYSLQDIPDANTIEERWEKQIESKRTPELDQMDINEYQQSIAKMNNNLQDIQQDIQRLTTQQNQMHAQHIQAQQLFQAQQIANMINQQYGSQQHISGNQFHTMQNSFGSTPHMSHSQPLNSQNYGNNIQTIQAGRDLTQQISQPIQFVNDQGQYIVNNMGFSRENSPFKDSPQYPYTNHHQQDIHQHSHPNDEYHVRDHKSPQPQNKFYLHDTPQSTLTAARRTWAQTSSPLPLDVKAWLQNSPKIDTRSWKSNNHSNDSEGGFMLHENGNNGYENNSDQPYQNLFQRNSESPQRLRNQRQVSKMLTNNTENQYKSDFRENRTPMSPSIDDMAPQSISFIGDEDSVDNLRESSTRPSIYQRPNIGPDSNIQRDPEFNLHKLNITSGKLTYRIPSPTRPSLNMNSFQDPSEDMHNTDQNSFYVAFDNDQPKRPKPPLRIKRSPKKERSVDSDGGSDNACKYDNSSYSERDLNQDQKRNTSTCLPNDHRSNEIHFGGNSKSLNHHNNQEVNESVHLFTRKNVSDNQMTADRRHLEDVTNHPQISPSSIIYPNYPDAKSRDVNSNTRTLVINDELTNLDPDSVDEMEKKKEKIMLLSLQRRQQQEEVKARKEIEAMKRREREQEKEEERVRKREEQAARRAAILEQHKLKKAIEEAEQKGITLDRPELLLLKQQQHHSTPSQAARLRPQKTVRPRPKTIHVESGSIDLSETSSLSSRNKKGSNSNLTGIGQLSSNSMRRDYYRGSQDSLAIRESPDEYPSTSSTPIGRRGSYKTSREPTIERGRTISRISVAKGSNLNFRGRKSNSLMNLCDTDSGLGRATPPRRAPSPGMGPSGRHLPSPSGPGSLPPGFMNKRRIFDDGSSDISSTPSSMLDYSGPKLYKQPATKSNRGIILNAVEYCVFPGVVNRDAKQRVLEKIARSEAKHFLILFRDAGCQFRALYSYWPENETVIKLYGTGPSQVDEFMFDKFFKYNSGGKCFSQIHTKHLTVTIDAFTIHNSLWQGKKVNMPSKKDMALVI